MWASVSSRSILVTSSPIAAPVRATVAGSMWSAWWAKKAITVRTRTGPVRRSSALSRIEAAASSSITAWRFFSSTCRRLRKNR